MAPGKGLSAFARELGPRPQHRVPRVPSHLLEVPRVLFLGICLDFHYFSTGVVFPKFGFDFSRGAVVQALVEP